MIPRLTLPPRPAALTLIALAFALPGLAGHDLWKSQDALGLGIVHGMATSGDYIVPRVGGWLWLTDPPLYHWVALAFGKALQPLLEFHAAARLASGAFVLAAFALIYRAASRWTDRTTAAAAMLLLLGSVGLMVHAHEAVPELAMLAALCGALAALPRAASHPLGAGIAFGIALGAAYLSSTWVAPTALFLAVAAAHFACPEWRTRGGVLFLALALLIAGVMAALWPLALVSRSEELFTVWWINTTEPHGSFGARLRYFLAAGSWFAWPAWPLALWTLWSLRRRWNEPRLFVPTLAVALTLAGLAAWSDPQSVTLVPLLAPLALLAAQGMETLRRGAAAALDWFGLITFAFFGGLVWLGYIAMMTGVPPRVANNFAKAAPGFAPEFQLAYFVVALGLTLVWIALMFFTAYSPTRSVARWAAGIVLLWGTFATLWMPWADFQKSYRAVALQLRSKIPVGTRCIAQRGLGLPQAAALDYHADIRPQAFDIARPNACPLLVVQGSPRHEFDAPGRGWTKLADVGRPGDKGERYRLYRLNK
ncbi:MAG TPA: glycosyltransferase family 39 protein [Burkholderiales bacterium]|jgi:4-amino-4-deoxy-L-arabinose transferase-like glycosyltransferase|nr:glycosyltransferase family 39 protein [Burkholderiales bacterium]